MSKRNLLLTLLVDAKRRGLPGLTTKQLVIAGCGSRFGARLQELRADGHVVNVQLLDVSEGEYLYSYVSGPDLVRGPLDAVRAAQERDLMPAPLSLGQASISPSPRPRCALDDDWDWQAA
jgi:hypothetical protein